MISRFKKNKLAYYGYFGDHKPTDEPDVWELRWKKGRRLYYAYIDLKEIFVIIGGNKNGQDSAITKARNVLEKKYR